MAQISAMSFVPLHQQVENYLREMIQQEDFRQGKLLPREEELAKRLGVSRNTFRAGMDALVREGLVVRKKGIGTLVTAPKISTSLSNWESFSREMDRQGRVIRTLEKTITWIEADEKLALAMGVAPGAHICRLDRLKGVEQSPVVYFESFLHPRIGIKTDEKFEDKLYTILADKYHCIPLTSNEEIGAIACTPFLKNKLGIHSDIPILYRKRHVMGPTDKLLELCYAYYRSDRFVYNIRIQRGQED